MPLPEGFIRHLRDLGYHPRSNKHSNALAVAIVHDLLEACPPMATDARAGRIVFELNMDLRVRTATWNVGLVLGTPPQAVNTRGATIVKATPATVQIAVEIKSVMTEHRKAVKNRKRDFEAHHEHVHNYSRRAIAGAVMVVNRSLSFKSPLKHELTVHGHGNRQEVARLTQHCATELRNVAESGGFISGMDAKTLLVVDFDNINLSAARYVTELPAPQIGDPIHYDGFLQKVCAESVDRYVSGA